MIQIIARRMAGGNCHEHISLLKWVSDTGVTGISTREEMVRYVKTNARCSAYTLDPSGRNKACVGVRTNGTTEYVQTYADGIWTNNLLSLPEF